MTTGRNFLLKGGLGIAAITVGENSIVASSKTGSLESGYVSKRPELSKRNFTSKAVEKTILRIKKKISDPKLAWLFENCFPNTLDTTVNFKITDNKADTGFMHETFHKDDPAKFTRVWFAWANTLFGELILKLEKENRIHLV